jgi:hypothetical protein
VVLVKGKRRRQEDAGKGGEPASSCTADRTVRARGSSMCAGSVVDPQGGWYPHRHSRLLHSYVPPCHGPGRPYSLRTTVNRPCLDGSPDEPRSSRHPSLPAPAAAPTRPRGPRRTGPRRPLNRCSNDPAQTDPTARRPRWRDRYAAPCLCAPSWPYSTPNASNVLTNASTTSGSNWVPEWLRNSATASELVRAVRYARVVIIAS